MAWLPEIHPDSMTWDAGISQEFKACDLNHLKLEEFKACVFSSNSPARYCDLNSESRAWVSGLILDSVVWVSQRDIQYQADYQKPCLKPTHYAPRSFYEHAIYKCSLTGPVNPWMKHKQTEMIVIASIDIKTVHKLKIQWFDP